MFGKIVHLWKPTQSQKTLISKVAIFIIFTGWLILGSIIYSIQESLYISQLWYITINIGYRIGYAVNYHNENWKKTFSILYMFIGVILFALINSKIFRGNCLHVNRVRWIKLINTTIVLVCWIIGGILLIQSFLPAVKHWSYTKALYSVFSYLWFIGDSNGSVPANSDNITLYLISIYITIGGIIVTIFYGYISTEFEVFFENHLIYNAVKTPFHTKEFQNILKSCIIEEDTSSSLNDSSHQNPVKKKRFHRKMKHNNDYVDIELSDVSMIHEEDDVIHEEDSKPISITIQKDQFILPYNTIRDIIFNRLEHINIPQIYYRVYHVLPIGFILWFLTGIIIFYFVHADPNGKNETFHVIRDEDTVIPIVHHVVENIAMAVNCALSIGYRIGFNSLHVNSILDVLFAIAFLLVGSILFVLLTLSVVRYYSFQSFTLRIRHQMILTASLLLVILINCIWLSYSPISQLYHDGSDCPSDEVICPWTIIDEVFYCVSIIVGYGNIILPPVDTIDYHICNGYSLISYPLFALLVAHLSSEFGVNDQQTFINLTIQKNLQAHDFNLLDRFDQQWETSHRGDGVKEYYILLILRLRDLPDNWKETINHDFNIKFQLKLRKLDHKLYHLLMTINSQRFGDDGDGSCPNPPISFGMDRLWREIDGVDIQLLCFIQMVVSRYQSCRGGQCSDNGLDGHHRMGVGIRREDSQDVKPTSDWMTKSNQYYQYQSLRPTETANLSESHGQLPQPISKEEGYLDSMRFSNTLSMVIAFYQHYRNVVDSAANYDTLNGPGSTVAWDSERIKITEEVKEPQFFRNSFENQSSTMNRTEVSQRIFREVDESLVTPLLDYQTDDKI